MLNLKQKIHKRKYLIIERPAVVQRVVWMDHQDDVEQVLANQPPKSVDDIVLRTGDWRVTPGVGHPLDSITDNIADEIEHSLTRRIAEGIADGSIAP